MTLSLRSITSLYRGWIVLVDLARLDFLALKANQTHSMIKLSGPDSQESPHFCGQMIGKIALVDLY